MSHRRDAFERSALAFLALCVAGIMAVAPLKSWLGLRFLPQSLAGPGAGAGRIDHPVGPIPGWTSGGVRNVSLSEVRTLAGLEATFEGMDYDWQAVLDRRTMVPRFYLSSLPPGLAKVRSVERRKRIFLKVALPLVLRVNEALFLERKRLLRARDRLRRGLSLARGQQAWFDKLREWYGAENQGPDELLRRVDAIPPSLALAQAVKESGWGTSRFAREGNALFGQRTWGNDGMVPIRRETGLKHRVKTFESLIEAVWAYAHNLNTHSAYAEFREQRAEIRRSRETLEGVRLAETLARYSERRAEYVAELRTIIRVNKLGEIDKVRLWPRGGRTIAMPTRWRSGKQAANARADR